MAFLRYTITDEATWEKDHFTAISPNLQDLVGTSECFDHRTSISALDLPNATHGCEEEILKPAVSMYQAGPFTISDQDMGLDGSPSDLTSHFTSGSPSYCLPGEAQSGTLSLPLQSKTFCPLLVGDGLQCTPESCGPNPACPDLSDLPDLEDSTSVPCIAGKLFNRSQLAQTTQTSPWSILNTLPPRPSASPSKKPARTSRQRIQRANPDDVCVKSDPKRAHLLVERRYRENLNGNMAQLHRVLLKTKRVSNASSKDMNDGARERQQASPKVRKSDVLLDAVDYVHQTEVEHRHMADEIDRLTAQVKELEKLVRCEDCILMQQFVNLSV